MDKSIHIDRFIVHILDSSVGMPVFSDSEHDLHEDINQFLHKHIGKCLADPNLKEAEFIDEDNIIKQLCIKLAEDKNQFIAITKEMAGNLYKILQKYPAIPSADLGFILFSIDGISNLAVLKFNYRDSYIHSIENSKTGNINTIIRQKTTLPNENQKIDEFFIINLDNLDIKLLEKKYELDGEKEFYLSLQFLRCTSDLSGKTKIKLLEKTANNLIAKHYGEHNLEKKINFKKVINDDIEEKGKIDIEKVVDKVFGSGGEIKESYVKEIEQKGIKDKEIIFNNDSDKLLFKKQKFITDTGIEIKVPLEGYHNKDKIEFINNNDGTISIILKNIRDFK